MTCPKCGNPQKQYTEAEIVALSVTSITMLKPHPPIIQIVALAIALGTLLEQTIDRVPAAALIYRPVEVLLRKLVAHGVKAIEDEPICLTGEQHVIH
jgi:hypothetical protein